MQKELNKNFYLMIQQELRSLALRSSRLTYGELLNRINIIEEKVIWSNWGLQGNLTKRALMEYLEVLCGKIRRSDKGIKFLGIYLFNKEVKESRKRMQKQYLLDFKE